MLDAAQLWLPTLGHDLLVRTPSRKAARRMPARVTSLGSRVLVETQAAPSPSTPGLFAEILVVSPSLFPALPATVAPAPAPPVVPAPAPCPYERAQRFAWLGLAERWSLSGPEALRLLGEPLACEAERQDRRDALLGAHRSLLLLAPDRDRSRDLLRTPSSDLDGLSMLALMLRDGLPGIGRVRMELLARLGCRPA